MKPKDDRLTRLLAFALLAGLLAGATGRLAVHLVNDSASYLEYPFGSWRAAMLSIRTPGYPLFLALVKSSLGIAAVPFLQVGLHVIASWAVTEELIHRRMPKLAAIIAGVTILLGCTAADHIHTVSTDAPAASVGVLTAVFLMRGSRSRSRLDWGICGTLAFVAIAVRPASLFLIPWIGVVGWCLTRHDRVASVGRDRRHCEYYGLVVCLVLSLLLVGWMTARKLVVNEFSLLPFGHQNLAAVLVQTVSAKRLRNLEGPAGELAELVADGLESGEYELPDADRSALPTMTIERQWDEINYLVIIPAAEQLCAEASNDATAVCVHSRIGALNQAILVAWPKGYLRWLVLAIRRAAWGVCANIVMQPLFLGAIMLGLVVLFWRMSTGEAIRPIVIPIGYSALAVVGLSYAAFGVGFVILSSPPLGRFTDAAAIFFAGPDRRDARATFWSIAGSSGTANVSVKLNRKTVRNLACGYGFLHDRLTLQSQIITPSFVSLPPG